MHKAKHGSLDLAALCTALATLPELTNQAGPVATGGPSGSPHSAHDPS
jgi:hypothetical protein